MPLGVETDLKAEPTTVNVHGQAQDYLRMFWRRSADPQTITIQIGWIMPGQRNAWLLRLWLRRLSGARRKNGIGDLRLVSR